MSSQKYHIEVPDNYVKPPTNPQPKDRLEIAYNNVQFVDINDIKKPIVPELDYCKVESLMNTIEEDYDQVPPIEALRSPSGCLYVFGGCHRFEAHKRLGKQLVKVNIRNATPLQLQMYLGSSYFTIEEEYMKEKQEREKQQP
ncbi:hypothetical protein FDP41_007566 [Naegleria fowleri]|uniref:sulfiredoxin n=1 Tax=Naegleria fowleri TaxID=5763 RepID=A0A6A5C914_NAEFO|nr:uncharacterized protein FDP41_007566 [Naegleria fowleri]KAF0983651.1 hypothetical protein FDP41_007566 [Naegleria fowleri]CAG4710328.1 unnamed protein product [Naegleria fowleri]